MKILCVGGGSGGHIAPIVAVIDSLRKQKPRAEIRVWCDRGFAPQARQLVGSSARVDVVASGKFRRYANISLWTHIRHHLVRTHLANFIDLFKIAGGFFQSLFKLVVWRPRVIFCKGGFVCLPVGLAAHILRIPLVIHDSDTVPGLTNRILARYAKSIGTGSPIENYSHYKKKITKYIGVPVRSGFKILDAKQKASAKKLFNFSPDKKLVVVVGGGLGSRMLNEAVLEIAPSVVVKKLQMLIVTGADQPLTISDDLSSDVHAVPFVSDHMPELLGAADVVVTRAGATFLAELATVAAPTIIVPNHHLAGDHQTKNAAIYEAASAALVVNPRELEKTPKILGDSILRIAGDEKLSRKLSQNLHKFARPDALEQVVKMILEAVK